MIAHTNPPSLQGELEKAEALCRRAIEILEAALGTDHPELTPLLEQLAHVWRARVRGGVSSSSFIVVLWFDRGRARSPARSRYFLGLY